MERDLEALTASLFAEANRMVATERVSRAAAVSKAENLEERLRDTEGLIGQQASQMQSLGRRIEDLEGERDALAAQVAAGRSGPANARGLHGLALGILPTPSSPTSPAGPVDDSDALPPLLLSHTPRAELSGFVRHLARLRASTLAKPVDSFSGSSAIGGHGVISGVNALPAPHKLSTVNGVSPEHQAALVALVPLSTHSSQPFVKRCVEEDSDPALRLDLAPGLNWLSRRTVAQAVIDGNLVIEPAFGSGPLSSEKCTLCGAMPETVAGGGRESAPAASSGQAAMRKLMGIGSAPTWPRWGRTSSAGSTHSASSLQDVYVFKTLASDGSTSAAYPLCRAYCLPRLRAVCEFWTYVRTFERSLLLEDLSVTMAIYSGPSRKASGIGLGTIRRMPSVDPDAARPLASPTTPVIAEPVRETAEPARPPSPVPAEAEASVESSPQPSEGFVDAEDEQPSAPAATGEADGEATVKPAPDEPATETAPAMAATRSTDALAPSSSTASPRPASPNPAKPPLPKRSGARTPAARPSPPVPARAPSSAPASPIAPTSSAPPPPRHPSVRPPHVGAPDHEAWEAQIWLDLTRLKRELFWARVGVQGT